jgi:sulfate/thiosulfate-binding protein
VVAASRYGFVAMIRYLLLVLILPWQALAAPRPMLLHVSYDATRELFADYNRWFEKQQQAEGLEKPKIRMSHGGSGKQARAVMDGLPADIVSLALGYDMDALAARGLVEKNWAQQWPHDATAFYSTIVLLVRKGNPKNIHGWQDLARRDVHALTPNPKTSGGARWGYLAAWAYAHRTYDSEPSARAYMRAWLSRVKVFDTGARAATTNFVRRGQGDVLITWETEARIAQHYFGDDAFEIIMPTITMKAEPKLAVLPASIKAHGTQALAKRYVSGLYEAEPQQMIVEHYFRTPLYPEPSNLASLKGVTLITIEALGGWEKVQREHFSEGGLFDQFTARGAP